MSAWWQGFWIGAMVAWTPSLIAFVVLLWHAPVVRVRGKEEVPQLQWPPSSEYIRRNSNKPLGLD